MQVSKHMNARVVTGNTKMPLPKIWDLLSRRHLHCLPIVDTRKKLIGMIAKQDILEKLYPEMENLAEPPQDSDADIEERLHKLKKMTAEKIMSTHIVYTRPDTNIMRALSRMITHKIRQLPVVDDNDRLVGMLSKADVFKGVLGIK